MLTSALKKLVGSSTEFDSYTLLRLQAKSYRLIKNSVSETLSRHGLSVLDWSLLGILFQKPEGGRFVEISQEMGVEPPFVTELVTVLKITLRTGVQNTFCFQKKVRIVSPQLSKKSKIFCLSC